MESLSKNLNNINLTNEIQNRILFGSITGLAFGIFVTRRYNRNPNLLANTSVYGLAGKALLIGTCLTMSTAGIALVMTSRLLGIRNVFFYILKNVVAGCKTISPKHNYFGFGARKFHL